MRTKQWLLAALVTACFCFSSARGTFATTASMDLTSPGSSVTGTNVLNGVYVGAYTATINGVSTPVICDDFADDSYVPETWTATVNTFSDLSGTKWYSQSNSTQLYEEAAYLVQQMMQPANASNPGTVGDISFAIWDLFDSNALAGLSATDVSNVNAWLAAAANPSNLAQVNFSDFTIYTPVSPSNASCSGSPCPTAPPQEFMTYNASEPSFIAILGADLLLFGCALVLLRRRGILLTQ